ncbi:MAG: RadC family protein [Thermaurantiacus sp.]
MTIATGEVRLSPAPHRPVPRRRARESARVETGARDRWLLMRLLGAAQSTPRVADRLLAERGSLGSVLATSDERLRQLGADGNGIAMLRLLREAIEAVLDPGPDSRPLVDGPQTLMRLFRAEMALLPVEQVRAAFLDAGQRLICIETISNGSVRAAPVYPRELARRCLELSATGLVLVHNHPSGDPTPSEEDREISRAVAAALETIDAQLIDHLVVARNGWASAMPAIRTPGRVSTVRISTARACADAACAADSEY